MTETPESDKEEFRAGKDDIPAQEIVEGVNADSASYLSLTERTKRWNEARSRAKETGNSAKEEYNKAVLERSRATKGPNPTQEKARKLYEWWQSGCGGVEPLLTQMTQDICSWENLHPYEQARWAILAKALGNHPLSDNDFRSGAVQQQAQKYSSIPAGISWADYDNALYPEEAGYSDKTDGKGVYIHDDDPTYEEWVESQSKQRQHWWQFWRPTEIFTDYDCYSRFIRNQARYRKAAIELGLAKSSR